VETSTDTLSRHTLGSEQAARVVVGGSFDPA
jgi:hypothetical protein